MRKRLAWLLALPYVVTMSTGGFQPDGSLQIGNTWTVKSTEGKGFDVWEVANKTFANDLAEALNAAHKRRLYSNRAVIPMDININTATIRVPDLP